MLFNVIPQLIDIVVACTYLALKMQPWAAVIVFITVGRGGRVRRRWGLGGWFRPGTAAVGPRQADGGGDQ